MAHEEAEHLIDHSGDVVIWALQVLAPNRVRSGGPSMNSIGEISGVHF